METISRFPSHSRETDQAHFPGPAADISAISMEDVPMSALGTLLRFSRAIIQAHNNAKVRNLMDVPPPETRGHMGRHVSPDASEKEPGATQPGGR
ncbi:hypothetical protein [Mesorhizobium sp. B4-1-1]|uniref:hypothetical protein n=1 Tax=Mesorhizobium sp. B4-1-1 TaxID=2589890 RepID=UPI00112AFC6B|nr:hypothetical protein [Mesorhizobium sp. B4-1-1]TPI16675.1 hypothetical protein FJW10_23210 [Mesorhizobium sp. B4-1-1]